MSYLDTLNFVSYISNSVHSILVHGNNKIFRSTCVTWSSDIIAFLTEMDQPLPFEICLEAMEPGPDRSIPISTARVQGKGSSHLKI